MRSIVGKRASPDGKAHNGDAYDLCLDGGGSEMARHLYRRLDDEDA